MIEWNYTVIAVSLMLLFFLLWKEVNRINKARLTWRLLATIFAVASLVCIALPITYKRTGFIGVGNEAVVLTAGFNADSVDNFLSRNIGIPLFSVHAKGVGLAGFNAGVTDIGGLVQQTKNIQRFHVFGYGLPKEELDKMNGKTIVLHEAQLSSGITSIDWKRHVKTGEKLYIRGHINNASAGKMKVVLKSTAMLDSINVAAGYQSFELATIPKHSGRTTYTLTLIANGDKIEKENIPVQVEQGDPLKVLMLASSPSFEMKFLKNFLGQNGFEVVSKTTISKSKFVKSYLNSSSIPVQNITPSLLNSFDITITDATALKSISSSELAVIQTQVANKSMGLIVSVDSAISVSFLAQRFAVVPYVIHDEQNIHPQFADSMGTLPALPLQNAISLRTSEETQPMVVDTRNRIFASCTLYGAGKIMITTLPNTFSWALAGYQNDYDKYWTEILNKVAPKKIATEVWSISPAMAEVDAPVQVQLQTINTGIPKGLIETSSVFLAEHPDLPFQWTGTFYPTHEGWQTGITLEGGKFFWYAFNPNNWRTMKASKTLEATRHYMSEHPGNSENINQSTTYEVAFPKVVFFLIFLICTGFLWAENKL